MGGGRRGPARPLRLRLGLVAGITGTRPATTGATAAPPGALAHAPGQDGTLPTSAEQQAAVQRFADLGRPIYCGARHGRLVALTFDDGPGQYTHIALRELRKAGARATSSSSGTSIARYPDRPGWSASSRRSASTR